MGRFSAQGVTPLVFFKTFQNEFSGLYAKNFNFSREAFA